jgi:hypothetical protein
VDIPRGARMKITIAIELPTLDGVPDIPNDRELWSKLQYDDLVVPTLAFSDMTSDKAAIYVTGFVRDTIEDMLKEGEDE